MIQTTVVGNYPKIGDTHELQKLRRAIANVDKGQMTEEQLRQVQDQVTVEVMKEQVDAGVSLVSDGQIRWDDEITYLARGIQGVKITGLVRFFDTNTYFRQPVVESPLKWEKPILVADYQFAEKSSRVPVKAVLTGPYTLAALSRNEAYSSFEDLVMGYAGVLAQETKALQEAGASFIQFNEPSLLFRENDAALVKKAMGGIVQVRGKAKVALYTYFRDASPVYRLLLDLPVQVLGFDLVMGPGVVSLLKKSPPDQEVALGILDARNTRMESPAQVLKTLESLDGQGHLMGRDCYLNPSCGLEFLPREKARKKLELLTEIGKACSTNARALKK